MASVSLRGISKAFGAVSVIKDLNLTIDDGAFTVFVGPSGCGKSTLLRMVAGLEEASKGDMVIGGKRANAMTPVQRGVSMVFQNYALYPHMTVEKNIGFSLRMAGMRRADINKSVALAAATLQIEPLLQRRPAQLSGGQRQRVAIGRAIVRNPEVFLFDEPLSNLDAELRVSMRVEIARLHQRLKSTMIYVTHDQTEAMTLADQIVVMRAGVIEQTGSPEELYDDPSNIFVAGFIGSPRMNFLAGTVGDNGAVLVPALQSGELAASGIAAGTAVTVGIRPEHVRIGEETGVMILGRVDLTENVGGTRYIHATLDNGETVISKTDQPIRLVPGEAVRFGLLPDRPLYFTANGLRARVYRN